MNGFLPLPLNPGQFYKVFGGPYHQKPSKMVGVRMAAEIDAPAHIVVPTRDFSVPDIEAMTDGIDEAVSHILLGRQVYVGCMGGIGRTGLFLAVLAKAFDVPDPVAYVRRHYLAHAVETQQQRQYVAEFVIPGWTKKKIALARFLMKFSRKKLLTKE